MAFTIKNQFARLKLGRLLFASDVTLFSGAGAPTNGGAGTGAGFAGPGSLYIDNTVTTTKVYINTNTKASPTWVSVGSQT
jgi:hypothetical protein